MSKWVEVPFSSLYGVPSKNGLMAPARVRGTGALLVNMREIFAFDVVSAQEMERAPLPEKKSESWVLRDGDLLFARQSLTRAGAGKVSLVHQPPEPMTFESHIIRVRLDETHSHSRFYYYLFRSAVGRRLIETIVEQVAAAGIRASDLGKLRVPRPPLDEQRRIAAALGAFDDLIEANRSLVTGLRDQASSAYARASANGTVIPFQDVADLVRAGVRAADLRAGTPYIGLEHFDTDGGGLVGVGDAGQVDSNKTRFRIGDVLYGKLRPYFRKFDRPGFEGVCSTEIWVLRPQPGWGGGVVNAIVAGQTFTDFAMSGSSGTRMPRADWNYIRSMPVEVPPAAARENIERILDQFWCAQVQLRDEIADLTRTRDELLPLLMSGRVRVEDVEGMF